MQTALIATSVALVALLSKSVITSIASGIGIWYFTLLLIPAFDWIPIALKGIINPVLIVGQFLTLPSLGPTITDLTISVLGALLVVMIFSIFAHASFKRAEVLR